MDPIPRRLAPSLTVEGHLAVRRSDFATRLVQLFDAVIDRHQELLDLDHFETDVAWLESLVVPAVDSEEPKR